MESEKIETLFVDFILKLVGPNELREIDLKTKYNLVKNIIDDSIKRYYPDFVPHIFPYGSFPLKTYLKESDIDITILLEEKINHNIIINITEEVKNNIIYIIKDSFVNYNDQMKHMYFTDINIINADIKLIKCQIQSIPLDISINNVFGLFKIIFMNSIFNQIGKKFNSNKLNIFKRSIILIKAWCTYEGTLMGSNIGLMASYALESLIIHMFNLYHKEINSEIESFFYFLNLMNRIDLENNLVSTFGLIPISDFNSKIVNSDIDNNFDKLLNTLFSDNKNNNNNYLFDINEIKLLITKIYKSPLNPNYKNNKDENLLKKLFYQKLVNIFDQINISNNLGKSINYHSYSKMKNAFKYMQKEIKIIKEIKQKEDPFLYINSLFSLFSNTLNMNFIELFINYLNEPKIIIDNNKDEKTKKYSFLRVNKDEIKKFNKLFLINSNDNDINNKNDKSNEFDEDEESEEEEFESEEKEENKKDIQKNCIKYEYYDIIINNQIVNKLFELHKINSDLTTKRIFYEKLNKDSNDFSSDLEKFMNDYKLI